MASETLDSGDRSPEPSPDPNSIPSPSSLSRLNAEAPEFVPSTRSQPPAARPVPANKQQLLPHHHNSVQYHNGGHNHHRLYHHNHNSDSNNHHHNHHQKHWHHNHQAHGEHDHCGSTRNGLSDESFHKTLNQVEYYFSDLNLATTDHLMRHINNDPEGYVPISVVASFKKIKSLISSHSQLASVLRNSSKLEVSEDGKKVRRLHPFSDSDVEELQSRVIIAENLPEDHCHQNLMKFFSAVGSVKAIRTCQPQASNSGASASRSGKSDVMHYSNKLHAFVEYESVELAEKAVEEFYNEGNWRSGVRVRLMQKHGLKPVHPRGKKSHEGEEHTEEDDTPSSEQRFEKQLDDPTEQFDGHLHEQTGEDNTNEKEGGRIKGRGRGLGRGRGRGQYHYHNNYNHHNNRGGASNNNSAANVGTSEVTVAPKQPPPGPRMPDGTRGFAMGRGKPVAVDTL